MSGGVCDLPGERCFHPISCEERGCVKQRPAPKPKHVVTLRPAVEGLEAHARELAHRIIMEFRPNGWQANEDELYRLLLSRFESLTAPPARTYAEGVSDVVNLCEQWSEPGAKVLSSMSGLTDAEHDIAKRTAEGIAEAARDLLSQGEKA